MATCCYFLVLIIISTLFKHGDTTRDGITLRLIHRFSPSLPFHKSDNFHQFLERNAAHTVDQSTLTTQQEGEGVDVPLIYTPSPDYLFFVNVSIGDPPIPQYLAMDIGSNLVWVIGGKKKSRYSPEKSSTYINFSCYSRTCKRLYNSFCDEEENCICPVAIGDGHMSDVDIASDQLVLNSSVVEDILIGINFRPKGKVYSQDGFCGVFGLGPNYPSFSNWLTDLGAHKFSYYIDGKVTNGFHPRAMLTLGGIASVQGQRNTTPIHWDGTRYLLSLQSLSLGQKELDINSSSFAYKYRAGTGVTISTSTVFTYLTDTAYSQLSSAVAALLGARKIAVEMNMDPGSVCFYGSLEKLKRSGFPVLSFNFAEGASLKLDEDDLFIKTGVKSWCMTVKKSSTLSSRLRSMTIIGLTAQQDYVVGFDLENSRLSFKLWNNK